MENTDDWVAVLRAAATELQAVEVLDRIDETTAPDPRGDDCAVLVTGRGSGPRRLVDRLGGTRTEATVDTGGPVWTLPAAPAGTRWCAAPALDLVGGTARAAAERWARRSDAVVHVVPAAASIDSTDLDFLTGSAVAVAHVPAIAVVVAGLDRIEDGERDPVLAYVRDAAQTVNDRIVVAEWPGDDLEEWWRGLFPDREPCRAAQFLAQLADCADAVTEAATGAADRARQMAPDEHLVTAGRIAVRSLDAAAVRRQLRTRQEKAVAAATRSMAAVAERLAAETAGRIRAAGPDGVDAVLDRFPAEADHAVEGVQETFERAVQADVTWFDDRLTALFEAMGDAGRAGLDRRPSAAVRPMPAHREPSWVSDKVAPLVGTLSRAGTRLAIGLIKNKLGGDASTGARGVTVKVLDGSTDVAVQVGQAVESQVASWLERWDRSRRTAEAEDATRAATGLLVRETGLAEAARAFYDGLADEFDRARGTWQETGDRSGRLTAAEARTLALAEQARTVSADVHRAAREAL
jgi:hypothetical protein